MRKRAKVAITIAAPVLAAAERERKRTGESRSAVFERALLEYFAERTRVEAVRRYSNGYQHAPERAQEIRVSTAMALSSLGSERWDAEG